MGQTGGWEAGGKTENLRWAEGEWQVWGEHKVLVENEKRSEDRGQGGKRGGTGRDTRDTDLAKGSGIVPRPGITDRVESANVKWMAPAGRKDNCKKGIT